MTKLGYLNKQSDVIQHVLKEKISCFELTKEEISRSQIVILNKEEGSNIKYTPFAFTELGVAMLSSVLNSPTAIEINRGIMRAFVAMRQLIHISPVDNIGELKNELKELKEYIEDVFTDKTT